MVLSVATIHETEIKQFGDRNDRNRIEIISTLNHKSQIVETNYEGRNRLRGSKVETNYEGRNRLRGSKGITRVETDYEGKMNNCLKHSLGRTRTLIHKMRIPSYYSI